MVLCMIIAAFAAGMVEFYKNFVDGADQALNGNQRTVKMHIQPAK